MDAGTLRDWAGVAAFIISTLSMLYVFLTSKSRANEEKLDQLDKRVSSHGARLDAIDTELKHMPAKDDVTELKLNIAELRGVVGRLDESVSSISKAVDRIDGFIRRPNSKS